MSLCLRLIPQGVRQQAWGKDAGPVGSMFVFYTYLEAGSFQEG